MSTGTPADNPAGIPADVLEHQPGDPTQVAGWLERLHTAAVALLPERFVITAAWNDDTTGTPLTLTFHRHSPAWDPGEVQYRVTDAVTVPYLDGTGETTFTAGMLAINGQWLNRRYIRRPLAGDSDFSRDLGNRITEGVRRDRTADKAILLSELVRVVRLRQRVGETGIRNGGHDTDIADLQARLAATLST